MAKAKRAGQSLRVHGGRRPRLERHCPARLAACRAQGFPEAL